MGTRDLLLGLALSGAPSCVIFSCFVGRTRVLTPEGWRRIDTLEVDDAVWSWSLERSEAVVGRVTRVMRSRAEAVYTVQAGELRIDGVTANHPVWSPARACWVRVDELRVGDSVLGWLGADVARELAVTHVSRTPGDVEVFDLTVEGEHDFFAEGLLVHNKSYIDDDGYLDDEDGDGFDWREDCDDFDALIHPGATELCIDELDNDCDGLVDDDDNDCAGPILVPALAARCETLIVSLQPMREPVSQVRFVGPADIEVLAMEAREQELLLTLEVGESSNEGFNDVVLTMQDDEEVVMIEAFGVQGDACPE